MDVKGKSPCAIAPMQKNSPRVQQPSQKTERKVELSGVQHFCSDRKKQTFLHSSKGVKITQEKADRNRDEWLRLADYSYKDLI